MAHEEEEANPEAPEWIVTFSDMITLLVTFFVLLLTFQKAEHTVKGTSGLQSTGGAYPGTFGPDPIESPHAGNLDSAAGAREEHSRSDIELPDDISKMGQKLEASHLPYDLNEIFDGLVLRFPAECSFAPGSATPTPSLVRSLREMSSVLKHYPVLITVEGHTDSFFQASSAFPDSESLSLARAQAAARILSEDGQLDMNTVGLAASADDYPRESNETPVGRLMNRRVELRLHKVSALGLTRR